MVHDLLFVFKIKTAHYKAVKGLSCSPREASLARFEGGGLMISFLEKMRSE